MGAASRNVLFGAAARLVATTVDAITGLVAVAIAVRLLGVSNYGILAFLLSVVALVAGVGRIGWTVATMRAVVVRVRGGEPEEARHTGLAAVRLAALSSAVGTLAIFAVVVARGAASDPASYVVLSAAMALLLLGTNIALAASSVARALGRVAAAEAPLLVLGLVRVVALVAVARRGDKKLTSVASAYGVAGLACLAVASWLVWRLTASLGRERLRRGSVRALVVDSAPYALNGLAALAISRFDVLVLGVISTNAAVGTYEPTLRIVERLMGFAPLLALAQFLPVASSLWVDGDERAFGDLYRDVSKVMLALSLAATVPLIAFPEAMLHTLYGGRFPVNPRLPWVLVAGFLPYTALAHSWVALAATGERRALVMVSATAFVTMVVSAIVLIPWFGPVGAALATATSVAVQQIAAARALYVRSGVHALDGEAVALMLAAVVLLSFTVLLRATTHETEFVPALAWSVALWTAWALTVWFVGQRTRRRRADAAPGH